MKKKIAVLLSGHIRTYEMFNQVLISLINNFDKHNYDDYSFYYFLHTWSTIDPNSDTPTSYEKLKDLFNFSGVFIDEYKTFPEIQLGWEKRPELYYHEKQAYNILSMHYSIQETNDLRKNFSIENNIEFDAVIRTRPDLIICEPIDFSKVDFSKYNFPDDAFGFADWFCIASPDLMDHYCSFLKDYDTIVPNVEHHGCFGIHKVDNHNLLLYHLLSIGHGFPINKIKELRLAVDEKHYEDELYISKQKHDIQIVDFEYYLLRPGGKRDTFHKKYRVE